MAFVTPNAEIWRALLKRVASSPARRRRRPASLLDLATAAFVILCVGAGVQALLGRSAQGDGLAAAVSGQKGAPPPHGPLASRQRAQERPEKPRAF